MAALVASLVPEAMGGARMSTEPTKPGWYTYECGIGEVFHLREPHQWSVHLQDGTAADCDWETIDSELVDCYLVPLVIHRHGFRIAKEPAPKEEE